MESMQGKLASSQFDFGYTEQFCIPGVTSVFFSCCNSIWGLSGVQSSKSRFLTCLIGEKQLLWKQCRGIGPHFARRGKSHWFSRVAAGTWGIFSSYSGDVHSKLEFVHWSQEPVKVWGTTQECKLGVAGKYRRFWKLSESSGLFFYLTQWYWDS